MKFEVTILGCNSAIPTTTRFPSAQVINLSEHFFLIDCGEGTQTQLRNYKFKFQKINNVFISHLHGDHYFGLIGMLSTFHILGRKHPLHIYSHPDLKEIIELQLKTSDSKFNYELIFHFLKYDGSEIIFENNLLTVETVLLNHRIPCCGFVFREKERDKKIIPAKLKEHKIPISELQKIKKGVDFITKENKIILNSEITLSPAPLRSYAYCSDTCYDENIIEKIKNVDLLYHEATFLENKIERAIQTFHSTAKQAATIAAKANAKQLIIGHYSSRYDDLQPLLEEAKKEFSNTLLGIEGTTYSV